MWRTRDIDTDGVCTRMDPTGPLLSHTEFYGKDCSGSLHIAYNKNRCNAAFQIALVIVDGNAVAHTLIQDWSHDVMLSARPVQAATKHLHEMLDVVRFTRVVAVEQPLHGQFPRQPPGQGPAPLDLPYPACVGCCAAGGGRWGEDQHMLPEGVLITGRLENVSFVSSERPMYVYGKGSYRCCGSRSAPGLRKRRMARYAPITPSSRTNEPNMAPYRQRGGCEDPGIRASTGGAGCTKTFTRIG